MTTPVKKNSPVHEWRAGGLQWEIQLSQPRAGICPGPIPEEREACLIGCLVLNERQMRPARELQKPDIAS